jgi:hypothetical protein
MPETIVRYELFAFLIAVAMVVAWKLLTGGINTRDLFNTGAGGQFSPARVQILLATLAGAGWYLGLVMTNPHTSQMPDVPDSLLLLLGGSHVTYLGAKGADKLGWFRSLLGGDQ